MEGGEGGAARLWLRQPTRSGRLSVSPRALYGDPASIIRKKRRTRLRPPPRLEPTPTPQATSDDAGAALFPPKHYGSVARRPSQKRAQRHSCPQCGKAYLCSAFFRRHVAKCAVRADHRRVDAHPRLCGACGAHIDDLDAPTRAEGSLECPHCASSRDHTGWRVKLSSRDEQLRTVHESSNDTHGGAATAEAKELVVEEEEVEEICVDVAKLPVSTEPSRRARVADEAGGIPEPSTIGEGEDNATCELCGGSDDPSQLYLCDSCNGGYHARCMPAEMRPPTPSRAAGEPGDGDDDDYWYCSPQCEGQLGVFEQILRLEIALSNKQQRQLAQVGATARGGKAPGGIPSVELLCPSSARYLWMGAERLLVDAFGSPADAGYRDDVAAETLGDDGGGGGMDRRYILASLYSCRDGPWDNTRHRTMVLRVGPQVRSVCTFRVLGNRCAAELIFAATARSRRNAGHFRRLHDVLVRALVADGVRRLVIHATATSAAGFCRYSVDSEGVVGVPLAYSLLREDAPQARRLLPRLLSMDSVMLVSPLTARRPPDGGAGDVSLGAEMAEEMTIHTPPKAIAA